MAKSKDAFRTIREVSEWLDTPAHVLRFWESKFTQVKPVKRAGGRRYYRPADMLLLGGIKKLLHDDGMTIRGVQKMLREQGIKQVAALSQDLDADIAGDVVEIAMEPAPDEAPMAVDVPTLPDPEPEQPELAADNVVPMSRRERRLRNNRRRSDADMDERQADLFGGYDDASDDDPVAAAPEDETGRDTQPDQSPAGSVSDTQAEESAPADTPMAEPVEETPEPVAATEAVDSLPAPMPVAAPEEADPADAASGDSVDAPADAADKVLILGADLPSTDKPLSEYAARDTVAAALISRSTRRALMRNHPEKLVELLPRLTALAARMGTQTKG